MHGADIDVTLRRMPGESFWALIERTRPRGGDVPAHAVALTDALVEQGVDATVSWGHELDEALDELDHWDLWGAAYLALGGCSDDAYEYARCWIVGRGREAWSQACADPEGFVTALFEGVADRDEVARRIDELGWMDGEPLLYAAGIAHERLTGTWRPPRVATDGSARPRGAPWDEDELPRRLPRLASVLGDWWHAGGPPPLATTSSASTDVLTALEAALSAFERGDHAAVVAGLEPVLDDPAHWELLRAHADLRVDAAYAGGISRLIVGDPDGAADWLRLVAGGPDVPSHVRRALAQIELARGELEAAKALLDDDINASLLDRALRMVVALREGSDDDARRRAAAIAGDLDQHDGHPWDLAGILVQLGLVLVEVGDASRAAAAAEKIEQLTAGAPPELPLVAQGRIVQVGALRLAGDLDGADRVLDGTRGLVSSGTCDSGLAEREQARLRRASGREDLARQAFANAIDTFRSAGERWLADATAREAEAGRSTPPRRV